MRSESTKAGMAARGRAEPQLKQTGNEETGAACRWSTGNLNGEESDTRGLDFYSGVLGMVGEATVNFDDTRLTILLWGLGGEPRVDPHFYRERLTADDRGRPGGTSIVCDSSLVSRYDERFYVRVDFEHPKARFATSVNASGPDGFMRALPTLAERREGGKRSNSWIIRFAAYSVTLCRKLDSLASSWPTIWVPTLREQGTFPYVPRGRHWIDRRPSLRSWTMPGVSSPGRYTRAFRAPAGRR